MNEIWSLGMTIEDAEKNIITHTLKFYYGNKTMTAKSLGISPRGLVNKLEKYGIHVKRGIHDDDEATSDNAGKISNR